MRPRWPSFIFWLVSSSVSVPSVKDYPGKLSDKGVNFTYSNYFAAERGGRRVS